MRALPLKKVAIIIPCHNEAKAIRHVIEDIPVAELKRLGYKPEILVIDNNSTDNTAEIATQLGAHVIFEKKKGKGNALRTAFNALCTDVHYVIMLDGDHTYRPQEIPRLLEPLSSNFCEVIVGSRLGGKMNEGALKFQNRLVNWGFTFLVRQFYKTNVTDVLSGFFAWKKEVVDELKDHLESEGFSIEMEMITKMTKLGFATYSVPISYDKRKGESKISALRDGLLIMYTLLKYVFWKPIVARTAKSKIA